MDRQREMEVAQALNSAIWLRDNVDHLSKSDLEEAVKSLGELRVFSSRQLCAIINGRLTHSTISQLIGKTDRTGGSLNPGTLDILRNILYSRANKKTDFNLIKQALDGGTSQNMVSKLTGVSQGVISRKVRNDGSK